MPMAQRDQRRVAECLRAALQGAETLDRRREVRNEALAEEVKGNDQTKNRGSRDTPAASS